MNTRTRRPRTAPDWRLSLAVAVAVLTAATSGVAAGSDGGGDAMPAGDGDLTASQRRVIREATADYRDVSVAVAHGYVPVGECGDDPVLGGMGYHYAKPELIADGMIDPVLPEVLVYAPDRRGVLQLVAVEYLKDDADGDLATDEDRPTLFGERFDGPMEGHEPGQPVHYDLHAWVWMHNPSGELAPFNPRVVCPAGEARSHHH